MKNQILKFTVENFLSFNARQTVDFSKDHVACFVGHNGSGKTNLLMAICELTQLFLNKGKEKRWIMASFDLQKRPTVFAINFLADGEEFTYTIEMLAENDTVIKEELRMGNKLVLDMELHSDIGSISDIEAERFSTYPIEKLGVFHLLYHEGGIVNIQNSAISAAIDKAGKFFDSILYVYADGRTHRLFDYQKELYNNKRVKTKVLAFMKQLDYGIDDIEVERFIHNSETINSENSPRAVGTDDELTTIWNSLEESKKALQQILAKNGIEHNKESYRITLLRRQHLKHSVGIGLESDRVKRLIKLLTIVFANEGKILLVDELERGFHELLVTELLEEIKTSVNQFLFTSHLLELMTRGCLEKNQVFSMSKEHGQSVIYPVSEIADIRDDRHSLKNLYRAGRIPGYPRIIKQESGKSGA